MAVDGIYETSDDSMAHSKLETRPWWDIQVSHTLKAVDTSLLVYYSYSI